jgi:hypothetical protein
MIFSAFIILLAIAVLISIESRVPDWAFGEAYLPEDLQ